MAGIVTLGCRAASLLVGAGFYAGPALSSKSFDQAAHISGSSQEAGMSESAELRPTSCKSVCQAVVISCLLLNSEVKVKPPYKVSTFSLAQFVGCDVELEPMSSNQA